MAHSRLNLNLLICLYHILKEQSVSVAARRMFVTQSAMSKSLAQLREKLNDPIIVRNKGRIEITATARAMQSQVENIVSSALLFFENTAFSPRQSRRCFSLLCDEVTMHHLLPELVCKLTRSAPSISIELVSSSPEAMGEMALGNVDLALLFSQQENPRLQSQTLLHDRMIVAMAAHHPLATQTLTEDNFTDYPFVSLAPEHRQYTKLNEFINTRFNPKIMAQLPSVNRVLEMLANTTSIAILPLMAMNLAKDNDQFAVKSLPFNMSTATTIPLKLSWMPGQNSNLANQWIRQWISRHFAELFDELKKA